MNAGYWDKAGVWSKKNRYFNLVFIRSVNHLFFSGVLALIIAYLINLGIQYFLPAYIDLKTILTALIVCGSIGVIFGVSPAKRAADLEPVEAIRYE